MVLTIIFLTATVLLDQQVVKLQAEIPPTPTITPTSNPLLTPTATPTQIPQPCLNLNPVTFYLTVDYSNLLQDSSAAIADVQKQIRAQSGLAGRRAGLVLTFGGTPTTDAADVNIAIAVVGKVNAAMQDLGKQGFVFIDTVYHRPLNTPGSVFSSIYVEIYLFALPGQCNT